MDLKDRLIEKSQQPILERVELPEIGETLWVRCVSSGQREAWEASIPIVDGKAQVAGLRARFLALCLCYENGSRIYSDSESALIDNLPSICVERLWKAADEINTISEAAIGAAAGN